VLPSPGACSMYPACLCFAETHVLVGYIITALILRRMLYTCRHVPDSKAHPRHHERQYARLCSRRRSASNMRESAQNDAFGRLQ
jgi:hypothetical protein